MRTIAVLVSGSALTIIGVVLLVLPGPGFVLIAAGLSILATRFEWARRPLDYARSMAQQGIDEVAASPVRTGVATLTAAALAAVGVATLFGANVPFVNPVSAVLLIISGLFLLATVVWARLRASN